MDMPYHFKFSKELSDIKDVEPGTGLVVHLLAGESTTGELKVIRVFSLDYKTSKILVREIKNQMRIAKEEGFDDRRYDHNLNNISKYNIKNLERFSISQ